MRNLFKILSVMIISTGIFFMAACGGGGGSDSNPPDPYPGYTLYDDFSDTYINKSKWLFGESVREIVNTNGNNELVLKSASPNPAVISSFPEPGIPVGLYFVNPDSIQSCKADVTILDYSIVGSGNVVAGLVGGWYNNGSSTGPGDRTGDIVGGISIQDLGDGNLFCGYVLWEIANSEGTALNFVTTQAFTMNIELDTKYTLYWKYDDSSADDEYFTFTLDNGTNSETLTVQTSDFAALYVDDAAVSPFRALSIRTGIDNNTSSGYIAALFDNVYINDNASVYDDFSSASIDETKWINYESVWEISNEKLRHKIRTDAAFGIGDEVIFNHNFVNPASINGIVSKVTLLTYDNTDNLNIKTGIGGGFYNDNPASTPGDRTGDISAGTYIGGFDNTGPEASWLVVRCNDADCNARSIVQWGKFAKKVQKGTAYDLYLVWDGSKFTFRIDDEEISYTPVTSINPVMIPWRGLQTSIFGFDPIPNKAVVESTFDDVRVK